MYKIFTSVLLAALMFFAVVISHRDGMVQDNCHSSPYSVSQVKKMMRYHGTLNATFDGQAWRFHSNGRWIRLDSDDVKKKCI